MACADPFKSYGTFFDVHARVNPFETYGTFLGVHARLCAAIPPKKKSIAPVVITPVEVELADADNEFLTDHDGETLGDFV